MRPFFLPFLFVPLLVLFLFSWAPRVAAEQETDLDEFELRDSLGNSSATNKTGCAKSTTCSSCTDSTSCVWCESNNECLSGNFYGPSDDIFSGCDDWRWEQCTVNGRIVFWVSGSVLCLLVLLAFMFCCLCCVCRRRKSHDLESTTASTWKQLQKDENEINDRKSKTNSARALLYAKYGTPEEREGLRRQRQSGFNS